ncbi:hypothetical protein JI739_10705 [Ramlibacter sp. AW1]|uniref:Uncharacterized protein n=1 Tax=Ramlibacter aurantiacus TaxID=2801330 RepID=A0A937D1R9_9BURK|nr:hypothetical protein [Ramlibacter aurantiacus]MBL0420814.1 hypothetical protein [Ramlibacter aurantiacus]
MKLHRISAATVGVLASTLAIAHEGHGLSGGSHWHATDVFGLLLAGGLAALAWWFFRGGK